MIDDSRALTIVHTDFHRGWGGQINQVLTSCIGLARRGHRVVLAVPEGGTPAERARAAGITVFGEVRFRGAGKVASLLRDALALRRLIATEHPDIIHSHGSQDTWAVALANKILPGATHVPHLLTRHNTKRVRDHVFNRWLLGRLIDRLIVVAPEVLDRYQPFVERGLIDPARVPVLPSPLRPDLLDVVPDRKKLRRELQIDDEALLVGTVARLVPDKGQRFLLAAADTLLARGLNLHVVLAGDGSDTAPLQALAAASTTLAKRVHFLGYRSDVADITAALDIAVLPSIDCDASSGVVKEALALGVPIVATDIGAARAMLGDGAFGAVVAPSDALALAEAIGAVAGQLDQARERAAAGGVAIRQHYTVERLVAGLEAVYREHARR